MDRSAHSYTLQELADLTNAKLVGNPAHRISGIAELPAALSHQAAFASSAKYRKEAATSHAGVIITDSQDQTSPEKNWLIHFNPSLAFQTLIDLFYKEQIAERTSFQGIHPAAVIHPTAVIGENAAIGPNAVIEKGAHIGKDTYIGPGTYVGIAVKIGEGCLIYPNCTIREYCELGARVILQPGAVIGSCGFGYIMDKKGQHCKLQQVGNVVLEDDVEIGANTTIDRARYATTRIKRGTKIDNLVQIAHNASIGQDNIIVAQTGIAGSTETGRHVMIGGQVAVDGHLTIGDGVMLSARSGVSKSLRKAGKYGGAPCFELEEFNRNTVHLRNIEKYIARIADLEKRLDALENPAK